MLDFFTGRCSFEVRAYKVLEYGVGCQHVVNIPTQDQADLPDAHPLTAPLAGILLLLLRSGKTSPWQSLLDSLHWLDLRFKGNQVSRNIEFEILN